MLFFRCPKQKFNIDIFTNYFYSTTSYFNSFFESNVLNRLLEIVCTGFFLLLFPNYPAFIHPCSYPRCLRLTMATSNTRPLKPVGSTTWISAEKENVVNLVQQEMDEVEYPVRNELEWLNEHMADVFSKNQLFVTVIPIHIAIVIHNILLTLPEILPIPSRHLASYALLRLRDITWRSPEW